MITKLIAQIALVSAISITANGATILNFEAGTTTAPAGWNVFSATSRTIEAGSVKNSAGEIATGVSAALTFQGGTPGTAGAGANWTTDFPTTELEAEYTNHGTTSVYNRSGSITFTISGLTAGTLYNIDFLAARGNTNTATMTANANGTTSGTYYTAIRPTDPGTFTWSNAKEGDITFTGNTLGGGLFGQFKNIAVSNAGTLTLTLTGTSVGAANNTALNMVSITQVPEPSTVGLFASCGLLALIGSRRRK